MAYNLATNENPCIFNVVEPSSTDGPSSPKRRLEDEAEGACSSSGDEKRGSFCGCCTRRQAAAATNQSGSTQYSADECQCSTNSEQGDGPHTEAEPHPPDNKLVYLL